MDIGAMRHRITIQKSATTIDAVGNHISSWSDFYSCWAEVNKASGREYGINPETITEDTLIFKVRWCLTLASLNSKEFRIKFNNLIYNISAPPDDVQFRHEQYKITATLEVHDVG